MELEDLFPELNDLLDSPALSAEELSPLVPVAEGEIDPRFKLLSYSSNITLHKCPRKFQLYKLLTRGTPQDESQDVTFAFGHAVGDGLQNLMITGDLTDTLWKMFISWPCDFIAENEKQKKSLAHAVAAIQMFDSMRQGGFLNEYEIATYQGKPAAELGFKILLPSGFSFRGYLDLALRNIVSGEALVLENKTDSGNYVNHYKYKNSAQAIGYSVVLDKIEKDLSSYAVQYLVYMTKLERYEPFDFPKTMHQRAMFLRDLMYDVEQIERYVANEGNYGIWPMRGESCVDFGKPCEFMDICHMDTKRLMKPLRQIHLDSEASKEYTFVMTLEELLASEKDNESPN